MNHHYPIIRKGHIRNSNPYHSPTLHHQGISYNGTIAYGSPYGASTERQLQDSLNQWLLICLLYWLLVD